MHQRRPVPTVQATHIGLAVRGHGRNAPSPVPVPLISREIAGAAPDSTITG
jgi:hypothetical protein